MGSASIIIIVTIVLYLAAMLLIGVYYGKKGSGSSSDDFYLGGRKMGPIVTAMSAEASDMSSYLLMGPLRPAGGHLDLHRSGGRHLPELADCGPPSAAVFCPHRRHHRAGLLLPPLRR